jgi:hypothetical protein
MFCYQESTKALSAVPCSREVFWGAIRSQDTEWKINARRAIMAAVEASKTQGPPALETWLHNSDYQRWVVDYSNRLEKEARGNFLAKSDGEKLMAYADSLKNKLLPFSFCCYEYDEVEVEEKKKNGTKVKVKRRPRKLKYCHLNGLVMLDLDHVENPMQIWYQLRDNKALMARTVFVHFTSSGRGLRIIFTADINQGNLFDNQLDFCAALGGGYEPDDSCKDATRDSFCPKEDEILFIDEDKLFNYYDEEYDKAYTPKYRSGKTKPEKHEGYSNRGSRKRSTAKTAVVAGKAAVAGTGDEQQVDAEKDVKDGREVDTIWQGEDIQPIIDYWSNSHFSSDCTSVSRHDSSVTLARDLFIMFDRDKRKALAILKAQPWVQEIIRERDEDVDRTVSDAANYVAAQESETAKKGKPWLPMPSKEMQEAVEAVRGRKYRELLKGDKALRQAQGPMEADINQKLDGWGMEIESMFDEFPLLRDICKGLKRSQYPAALFVAGGVLMTLMTRCWYRFYHRPQQERRLNCALFVIGNPASNKSMAGDICDILIAPIEDADKAGKAALNRYKRENKKKAANKEGKDKPQGIIRIHPARTSNGQMIEDMINAKEIVDGKEMQLHLFTFDTELDNSITLQGGGSWINKQAMELKAFHNEKDGQMYQNSDSPVDEFPVIWNYEYTGTDLALQKKVNEKNFGTGLSTRLAVIPMPKTNYEMIEFEEQTEIDWERINRMKDWAYKLDARAGELPLWPLVRRIYEWTNNCMDDCREDDSEANELMLKRVPYHALNYSAPFIDMRHWDCMHQEGKYWKGTYEVDDIDWKLCKLIARIQYATQQYFFGALAEKYFDDLNNRSFISGKRHFNKSVEGYNRLPEIFTREDVKIAFGYDSEGSAKSKVKRLQDENLAERVEETTADGTVIVKYRKLCRILT